MNTLSHGIQYRLLDAAAVSVQNGTAYALLPKAALISWQTVFAGTPASITALLQGSIDNSTWFAIDTSTSTAGEIRTIYTAVPFVRARISAVSAGSATAITVLINTVGFDVTVTTPGSGSGDIVGPGSSTDKALARFDGVTGGILDESPVIGEDDGRLSGMTDPTGLQDAATKNYVDSQIAGSTPVAGASQNTFLVQGGQVVWTSLYHFLVSAAVYYINGVLYISDETEVVLDPSDVTNPRLDVIVVNNAGVVLNITGTPAATPGEPDIAPGEQLKLALILVPANSTQPVVANELLYFQNAGGPTEWNWAATGTGFNVNSASNPLAPATKDIEGTTVANNAFAQGTIPASTYLPSDANQLFLFIRSKAQWANNRGLTVSLRTAGVLKGQAVNINRVGSFGFDSAITGVYQLVSIPISLFAIPAGTTITQVRITAFGAGHGFYLANINFQEGGASQQPTGITQDQADARYASRNSLFLTHTADATLPNSRRLVAGTNVTFDDSAAGIRTISASGGSGSGLPFMQWGPLANNPPASNPATINTRNTTPILEFDQTTAETAIFAGVLPSGYAGGGITVRAHWAAVPITGTVGWLIAIERIGDGSQDIDSDSFAADQTITAATVPGTSGLVDITSVDIADGAGMDSLAAGEFFRIRIKRDVATDTATGDAQLVALVLEEQP